MWVTGARSEIIGYDVAAAEAGEPPLFDADPSGIVRREADDGSGFLEVAFVSPDRALIALRCGSDVTVLDVAIDGAGRIARLADKVLLADIALADAGIATRLLIDDQAFGIYTIDRSDERPDPSVTETRIHYADGNRLETAPSPKATFDPPGTDLRYGIELTPFTGGEGGDSWRFVVDASDDGVDNFTPAENDPWVRYSVGYVGPWFGPEDLMVWLSTLDSSASMSVARYEPDGHLVDVHEPPLDSASAWARGEVVPWRVAFAADGRVLVLGNLRTYVGVQGAPGIPAHAWYDPEADPGWLNSEDTAPPIDWTTPVVDFEDAPDWYLGREPRTNAGGSACADTLFFDGPDGVERLLPARSGLGEIADTLSGPRRELSSEVPDLKAWAVTVAILARCPADGDGYHVWSFHVTPRGTWASRSIGTVSSLSRFVGGWRETDPPQIEVVLQDGVTTVLPNELFEPVYLPPGFESAATDQPITGDLVESVRFSPPMPTASVLNLFFEVARSLQWLEFEPQEPTWLRATALAGDLRPINGDEATLLVQIEEDPVLTAYTDIKNVNGVIFFYPPAGDAEFADRLAFWCGASLVNLTSVGDAATPYAPDELEAFAFEIDEACPR